MRIGVKTDVGLIRSTNEDRYAVLPYLLAVADGMGGVQAGEIASGMVIDVLSTSAYSDEDPERDLGEAVRRANELVYAKASGREEYRGMGTTVTALLIRGDMAVVAQVGDSRAYLLRDGEIKRLTQDHSLVGELLRNGSITPEEAMYHPQRNLLTRAIGTGSTVNVDTARIRLTFDDVIVLCTDGLTSLVDDHEIKEHVMRYADPQRASEALVDLANSRGGNDNTTVIVAHMLPPVLPHESSLDDAIDLDNLLSVEESVYSF
jgi:protein phosphatase